MTRESTLILLRCKLYSLKSGMQKAIDKGCSPEDLEKWEEDCSRTQQRIQDLEQ